MYPIWEIVCRPAQLFLGHPERAYLMAMGYGILVAFSVLRSRASKPLTHIVILLASILWLVFGLFEYQVNEHQAKTGVQPMRVDILFSWPPVFAVSLASLWLGIRSFTNRKSKVPKTSNSPAARPFRADLQWGSLFCVACVVVSPRVTIAADDDRAVLSPVPSTTPWMTLRRRPASVGSRRVPPCDRSAGRADDRTGQSRIRQDRPAPPPAVEGMAARRRPA